MFIIFATILIVLTVTGYGLRSSRVECLRVAEYGVHFSTFTFKTAILKSFHAKNMCLDVVGFVSNNTVSLGIKYLSNRKLLSLQ